VRFALHLSDTSTIEANSDSASYLVSGQIANIACHRIAHNVSSRKRIEIIARAKQLSVKVTNAKAKVTTEV
jgi:hypothetical protein